MRVTSSALVLVLLWAAACGGEEDTFTEEYNRAVQPISELGRDPGGEPRDYANLALRLRRARQNLARLDPPDGARDELEALRAAIGGVTVSLEAFARGARARDPVAQRRAARRLRRANARFRLAEARLHRAIGAG